MKRNSKGRFVKKPKWQKEKPELVEIIERCEWVRKYLNLNKSEFCRKIGIVPQTYNNFIGSQGSKPSIDLILGVVNGFDVEPLWLLTNEGPLFNVFS